MCFELWVVLCAVGCESYAVGCELCAVSCELWVVIVYCGL